MLPILHEAAIVSGKKIMGIFIFSNLNLFFFFLQSFFPPLSAFNFFEFEQRKAAQDFPHPTPTISASVSKSVNCSVHAPCTFSACSVQLVPVSSVQLVPDPPIQLVPVSSVLLVPGPSVQLVPVPLVQIVPEPSHQLVLVPSIQLVPEPFSSTGACALGSNNP